MNSLSKPLFLAAAIVAAFGAHAQETKPTITLNVSSFPDLDRGIKSAIPLYKKLHPEVEIKLTSLAYPDHHTAMTTILATGSNVPDVMAIDNGFIGKFALFASGVASGQWVLLLLVRLNLNPARLASASAATPPWRDHPPLRSAVGTNAVSQP